MSRATRAPARSPAAAAPVQAAEYSTLIGTEELARHLGDPAFVIVDVRHDLAQPESFGEEVYAKSHVPGAVFARLDRDLSAEKTGRNGRHPLPSPEVAAAVFGRLGIDATKQVVAYDQDSGLFAARLWWMLRWLGHAEVAVLDGGVQAWQRAGGVLSAEPTARPGGPPYPERASLAPHVDAAGVAARPARHALLDARSGERFRGESEPIDAVAGHIPGALNRAHRENLGAGGGFKAGPLLREEFTALLGGRAPAEVIHSCGSGVTACHNLLAMEHAGLAGSLLYPGSWSEWSADPARPIARG
jgi:thiosulfate/3-mercaptopyruvate sulfurtransferase